MSATLRVSDFAENKMLFSSPPPIINVPARQHPVTIHFSRRTHPDYITESVRKASKIHARLPPGGILIFLTGQNEILGVCRKLEAKYGKKALEDKRKIRKSAQAGINRHLQDNETGQRIMITSAQGKKSQYSYPDMVPYAYYSRCRSRRYGFWHLPARPCA